MRRIRLDIEYDGTGYAGWQRQENARAVQEVVEDAVARLTGSSVPVIGASRTDAGVHALRQVAHFDTESRVPPDKYCYALNTMLPPDIRVRASMEAAPDFHARFSAVGKTYRYQIRSAPHAGALTRNTHAHVIYPLDDGLMRREAQALLGEHDFAAFAASGSVVKDTVRTVYAVSLFRSGGNAAAYAQADERLGANGSATGQASESRGVGGSSLRAGGEITLLITGNGFLYNMVRIIAGTLISVGVGKLAPGAFARALASGSRLDLGVTAPAHGLTLMEVYYDQSRLREGGFL